MQKSYQAIAKNGLKISQRFKKNKKQADRTTPAPNKGFVKWRGNGFD